MSARGTAKTVRLLSVVALFSLRSWLTPARLAVILPFDRLGHHLPLVVFAATGHLVAVILLLVVPLYADGVNSRLLQDALQTPPGEPRVRNSFLFSHFSSFDGPVEAENVEAADAYLAREVAVITGLPTTPIQTFVYSDKLRLLPAELAEELGRDPIVWSSIGFDESFATRVEMVEGRLPEDRGLGETIEALLSEAFVNKHGLRTGDRLMLSARSGEADTVFDVEVTGVWRATRPSDPSWSLPPSAYDEVVIVPRSTFVADVAPLLGNRAWFGLTWYTHFPPESVTVVSAGRVRVGLAELQNRAARLLGGRLDLASPEVYLADFMGKAAILRTQLYIFSVPALLIVLLYILSTNALFAERQRAELAVLKGRGASRAQILGAYMVEGGVIDLIPLLLGPLTAFGAAQLIGRTEAFLQFGSVSTLPIRMTASMVWVVIGTLTATLLLGLVPVLIASRHTLISYQQQVVRSVRRPLWQRLYLDVLVLLLAAYGYYMLWRQGSLDALTGGSGTDPFSNPLSLLLPATALFGASLLAVRCFPELAGWLARVGHRSFSATTLLALRHLSRSPEQSRSIVLLTVLTLALGSFSASMAATLDHNDIDRILFAVGGPLRMTERAAMSQAEERWTFLPNWEHGQVAGVHAWSRLRLSDISVAVGGGTAGRGTLVALDRAGFHRAGWWRSDFAPASLGELMNVLAAEPQALIASRSFLAAAGLRLGDPVSLTVANGTGDETNRSFIIRAVVDTFPMVYPKPDEYVFVGNFDYIYLAQEPASHDLVMQLEVDATPEEVVAGIRQRGFDVDNVRDARALIDEFRARPERTGVVGLLSFAFVVSVLLTMLALLLYNLFSFRRRMVEIGVLRAAGLSLGQLLWLLAFELCFLTLTSALVGTAVGIGAARLFVPFYQAGNTIEARTPPFTVVIAWDEIGRLLLILGAMLLLTLMAMLVLLRRLRIHEAIKLGQELS